MSTTITAHNCEHFNNGDQVDTKDVTVNKDTGSVYHSDCEGYIGQLEDFTEEDVLNPIKEEDNEKY